MTTVLITGATSGIGRSMAFEFAKRGYRLILVARNRQALTELAKKINTKVKVLALDLSTAENCFLLYKKTKKIDIDIVINNAGFGTFGEFYKTNLNNELNLIDLNIKAVHILTKLYLRDFKQKNRGYILNTASLAGFCVGPLMATYYASKAYVLRLTQSIQQELQYENSNVHICALCPGPVDTGFNKRAGVNFSMKPMSSDCVAKYAIKKMFQHKTVIIPGTVCKLSAVASKMLPSNITGRVCYEIQKGKSK